MPDSNLPDAELDVLSCLYRQEQATARQVRESLLEFRPMTHGSVVTLLNRLRGKSLVSRKKADSGKAFLYRPTRNPSSTYRNVLSNLLQRVFGGDGMAMVASLFETQPPTPEQLDELQELLDRLRRKNGQGGRG